MAVFQCFMLCQFLLTRYTQQMMEVFERRNALRIKKSEKGFRTVIKT